MTASFIVLTSARSGSTWLVDILNRHESLCAHGESFNPDIPDHDKDPNSPEFVDSDEFAGSPRPISTIRFLKRYFPAGQARGFKLLYGHARKFPEVILYSAARRAKVVHLIRRNQLDVLISLAVVYQHLKTWAVRDTTRIRRAEIQVDLDPAGLVSSLNHRYRIIRIARVFLRMTRQPHVEVFYEDLSAGEAAFHPIWEFLGVEIPTTTIESDLKKIQTRSHRDVIGNYPQVKAALAGTAYEKLLQE